MQYDPWVFEVLQYYHFQWVRGQPKLPLSQAVCPKQQQRSRLCNLNSIEKHAGNIDSPLDFLLNLGCGLIDNWEQGT